MVILCKLSNKKIVWLDTATESLDRSFFMNLWILACYHDGVRYTHAKCAYIWRTQSFKSLTNNLAKKYISSVDACSIFGLIYIEVI